MTSLDGDCTCGHGGLQPSFHMTPCPIKVRHLETMRVARQVMKDWRETLDWLAER